MAITKALKGKIAVVTGGSRGIGAAIAKRLALDGATVVINYHHNAKAAREVLDHIEKNGGEAFAIAGDVGSVKALNKFFLSLDNMLLKRGYKKELNILVNNAGNGHSGSVEKMSEHEFDQLTNVHMKGAFFMSQLAIPRLAANGRIINISSVLSRKPNKESAAYSMVKAAINTLTLSLAMELGKRGITVNTLSPGWTLTDINADLLKNASFKKVVVQKTALGRIGHVEDIAKVASFLASQESQWVTGQYIEASGGFNIS